MSQAWLTEVVLDRTFLPVFLTRPWEKESQTFRWPFPWISSPRRRSFPCTHHTRYWTHTRETTLPPVEGWQGKLWLQTRDRHYLHFRKGAKECCSCCGHREENPKYLDNSRYIESVKKKIIKRVEPSSLAKSSPSLSAKSAPVKKKSVKTKTDVSAPSGTLRVRHTQRDKINFRFHQFVFTRATDFAEKERTQYSLSTSVRAIPSKLHEVSSDNMNIISYKHLDMSLKISVENKPTIKVIASKK